MEVEEHICLVLVALAAYFGKSFEILALYGAQSRLSVAYDYAAEHTENSCSELVAAFASGRRTTNSIPGQCSIGMPTPVNSSIMKRFGL